MRTIYKNMIEYKAVVIEAAVPLCPDWEALSEAYEEFVRSFRQVSSDLGASPGCAPLRQYCPLVIALQNAARDANQAHENYQQHAPDHKC